MTLSIQQRVIDQLSTNESRSVAEISMKIDRPIRQVRQILKLFVGRGRVVEEMDVRVVIDPRTLKPPKRFILTYRLNLMSGKTCMALDELVDTHGVMAAAKTLDRPVEEIQEWVGSGRYYELRYAESSWQVWCLV